MLHILQVATVIEFLKSYSSLLISVLMFMTADYLLYKPNIIFLTVCSCVSYFLMTGAPSVTQLRVSTNYDWVSEHNLFCFNDAMSFCYVLMFIRSAAVRYWHWGNIQLQYDSILLFVRPNRGLKTISDGHWNCYGCRTIW